MGSFQSLLIPRPSSVSKCLIAGLCFSVVVTAGSLSQGYICTFVTSMILIVSTVLLTLCFSQNSKQLILNQEEGDEGCSVTQVECEYMEEFSEGVAEQVAEKEEGCGSIYKVHNFLATVSEEERTCENDNESVDVDDDDHCMTTSEDDEDLRDNYVARSSLSSEDDGSISDEDTLIELELPTGHYLNPKKYRLSSRQKPRWMELLFEANSELASEEDNLIEIDISAGSIICPRFEIEA